MQETYFKITVLQGLRASTDSDIEGSAKIGPKKENDEGSRTSELNRTPWIGFFHIRRNSGDVCCTCTPPMKTFQKGNFSQK